jgi:uncharacterized small protein (DUF1192 family)
MRDKAAFRENEIDESVLPSLTEEHLKQLGVTALGHRVKLLDAIAALRADASSKAPSVDAATASSAPAALPEDRAERRQVTVMFSDLVGSAALSARMDPEDLREVISAYQKCVADTVQRFGGFVAKTEIAKLPASPPSSFARSCASVARRLCYLSPLDGPRLTLRPFFCPLHFSPLISRAWRERAARCLLSML